MAKTVAESTQRLANRKGRMWSARIDSIDPAGADDHFFHFKNTSSDRYYEIVGVDISSTVAGSLEVKKSTGSSTSPTTVTPESSNLDFDTAPVATIETGTDLQLTAGGHMMSFELEADVGRYLDIQDRGGIIVGPGKAVLFNWEAATGILDGTVYIAEVGEAVGASA